MGVQDLRFRVCFLIVNIIGLLIFLYAVINIDLELWYLYLFWMVIFTVIEMRPISLNNKGMFSLSFPFTMTLMLIYGIWFCVLITCIGSVLADTIGKRGWKKVLFNGSQFSISALVAGVVYGKLSPPADNGFVLNEQLIPFAVAAFTYLAVNYLLVRVIISLAEGMKSVWPLAKDIWDIYIRPCHTKS